LGAGDPRPKRFAGFLGGGKHRTPNGPLGVETPPDFLQSSDDEGGRGAKPKGRLRAGDSPGGVWV